MKNDGTQLIVATNAAFAPFEYKEGENYYGIDMEIMDLFAKEIGKELYIYDMTFDAVCLAVSTTGGDYSEGDETIQSGICDIAAAGLTVREDRAQILDFSDTYYNAAQMLIVAADDTTFDNCKTKADVEAILNALDATTKVGTQNGTTGKAYCEGDAEFEFDGYNFTTIGYDNGALAAQNILNGTVKYVIIDEGPAKAIVANINAVN
jgi:polar amino acid transport system substrate-binding protein